MYFISDDKSLLQEPRVQSMLSTCYWADKRSIETIRLSIENSICFGAYLSSDGNQIAFARVISDLATTWYLCDVVVDEKYRGRGIATELVNKIADDGRFKNLRGILATRDAQHLYKKFGFEMNTERFMERQCTKPCDP